MYLVLKSASCSKLSNLSFCTRAVVFIMSNFFPPLLTISSMHYKHNALFKQFLLILLVSLHNIITMHHAESRDKTIHDITCTYSTHNVVGMGIECIDHYDAIIAVLLNRMLGIHNNVSILADSNLPSRAGLHSPCCRELCLDQ